MMLNEVDILEKARPTSEVNLSRACENQLYCMMKKYKIAKFVTATDHPVDVSYDQRRSLLVFIPSPATLVD